MVTQVLLFATCNCPRNPELFFQISSSVCAGFYAAVNLEQPRFTRALWLLYKRRWLFSHCLAACHSGKNTGHDVRSPIHTPIILSTPCVTYPASIHEIDIKRSNTYLSKVLVSGIICFPYFFFLSTLLLNALSHESYCPFIDENTEAWEGKSLVQSCVLLNSEPLVPNPVTFPLYQAHLVKWAQPQGLDDRGWARGCCYGQSFDCIWNTVHLC